MLNKIANDIQGLNSRHKKSDNTGSLFLAPIPSAWQAMSSKLVNW